MNINETKKVLDIKANFGREDNNVQMQSNMNKNIGSKQVPEEKPVIDDKNMLSFLMNKMKEMETEYDLVEHLVLDIGNAFTEVGFSGEDLPTYILPSIFGKVRKELIDKKSEISFEIKYIFI